MNKFTNTQRRVIRALYQLDRWATTSEIADWADGMSWNTAQAILIKLRVKKIVESKIIDHRRNWMINEF